MYGKILLENFLSYLNIYLFYTLCVSAAYLSVCVCVDMYVCMCVIKINSVYI